MLLNVQKYLLTHSLADLARDHGVYARFSTVNPLKFSLNYDQLEAKDGDIIASECRGLVLECKRVPMDGEVVGDTRILALPMHRFFNHGTGYAAPVDFNNARFYEKLDGTCCIMYWDRMLMRWCIATRSVPDADRKTFAGHIQAEGAWMMAPFMSRYSGKCSSFHGWIILSGKNGEWSHSFLDGLLGMMERV